MRSSAVRETTEKSDLVQISTKEDGEKVLIDLATLSGGVINACVLALKSDVAVRPRPNATTRARRVYNRPYTLLSAHLHLKAFSKYCH